MKKYLVLTLLMGFTLLLVACGNDANSETSSEEEMPGQEIIDQEPITFDGRQCVIIDGDMSMDDFFDNTNEIMDVYFGDLDAFFNGRIDNYTGIYTGIYDAGSEEYVILFADSLGNWQTPEFLEGVGFKVCQAEYSYDELAEIITEIDNNHAATSAEVTSWGIDTLENRVLVYLAELTDEAMEDFKANVSDSLLIDFREGVFVAEDLEVDE